MEPWRRLSVQTSEDSFNAYRDDAMCCSAVTLKRDFDVCTVCGGMHIMVERRFSCTSKTCSDIGICAVVWKVFTCTASDTWTIWVNEHGHMRGVVPCSTSHPVRVTTMMKQFLAEQDEIGIPPRLMLVNLKKQSQIPVTSRGWPSLKQVQNALKRLRRDQGTKNSRKAIQDLCRLRCYRPGLNANTAFLFGASLDSEGYAYVGLGSDEDPFIIGITSLAMIDGCLRFANSGSKCQFHADATFKLSDIGYPVVTCGFMDKARAYQVGAFFVVSRRTAHEYTECFRSFVELIREVRGVSFQVDTVMGDAEDAQYIAVESISAFADAKKLMCFFHVLYNVRKRIQHLPIKTRMMVMSSIVDMHYATGLVEFELCRDRELQKWKETTHLKEFATYFDSQWLKGRYWRWQAYHTPAGYASTNNPCENLNGAIKLFLQRRRHHMRRLLLKLCDFIESITPLEPAKPNYTPKPTTDVVNAAIAMTEASRVQFERTSDPNLVRVIEVNDVTSSASEGDEAEYYFRSSFDMDDSPSEEGVPEIATRPTDAMALFRTLTSGGETGAAFNQQDPNTSGGETGTGTSEQDLNTEDTTDQLVQHPNEDSEEQEEELRIKQKDLYDLTTKWSLRRAHQLGMPTEGWLVDLKLKVCGCRYFGKFLVCAHLVAAQQKYGIITFAPNKIEKLVNRVTGKSQAKRSCAKVPKRSNKKRSSKTPKPRAKAASTSETSVFGLTGRPPLASTALIIEEAINE